MSGFPVNGKFGLFPRFEAEKSKKNGKPAFTVKFLTAGYGQVSPEQLAGLETVRRAERHQRRPRPHDLRRRRRAHRRHVRDHLDDRFTVRKSRAGQNKAQPQ